MNNTRWFWLVIVVLVSWLLYLAMPILTPFLVSALLAYLMNPMVTHLETWHFPRLFATFVVFVLFFGSISLALLYGLPLLQDQAIAFINQLPFALAWVQTHLLPWLALYGIKIQPWDIHSFQVMVTTHWQQVGTYTGFAWQTLLHSSRTMFGWAINILLIPVLTFYLLRDWPNICLWFRDILPRPVAPTVLRLVQESDQVLSAFLRGQLWVIVILTAVYSMGLALVGLPFAFLLGLLSAVLSIVPYLGIFIAMTTSLLVTALQFHDWAPIGYVLVVFGIGHVLEGMVIVPWLIGNRVGLHPVVVIFAVLTGGQFFGIAGVLLALPVAAILKVIWRYMKTTYLHSKMYHQVF